MLKKRKTRKKREIKKITKSKKLSQKDYEKKAIELAGKGLTAEKIGEELRQQNIHPKEYAKKISKETDIYVNSDLKNVGEKLERIKKHLEKNKKDKRAMREKVRVFAQLRKLKKYFGVE